MVKLPPPQVFLVFCFVVDFIRVAAFSIRHDFQAIQIQTGKHIYIFIAEVFRKMSSYPAFIHLHPIIHLLNSRYFEIISLILRAHRTIDGLVRYKYLWTLPIDDAHFHVRFRYRGICVVYFGIRFGIHPLSFCSSGYMFLQNQYSFAPAGMWGSTIRRWSFSSSPSLWMADSSMPQDSMPIMGLGGRLVMAMQVLPMSCSGS